MAAGSEFLGSINKIPIRKNSSEEFLVGFIFLLKGRSWMAVKITKYGATIVGCARMGKNWSQGYLAYIAKMSIDQIDLLETGRLKEISDEQAKLITDELGMDLGMLSVAKNKMPPEFKKLFSEILDKFVEVAEKLTDDYRG